MSLFVVLGRMCLSLIFILSGISQILNWQSTETFLLNGLCEMLAYTQTMPMVQDLLNTVIPWAGGLLMLAVLFQLIGGIFLFLGIKVRFAAFLLLLFLIPVTLTFHSFWYLEGQEKGLQIIMFLKNLSIFGALLYVLGMGRAPTVRKEKKGAGD